ncbi:MAG: alpha-D-ribose 1-methylphosphonate 5-phosphate C-P-lyase PhnJ [Rhizobacter sp.]|nr:alpha-D-ribose 1-methylphosphonate 5-phosphate C-P-lyase PhnJ [Rhizobacter sp.]
MPTLTELATPREDYAFAFMDAFAKRELRRRTLKAIAIPGYQVPYASRELPIARGWGTGGLQVTLSLVGPESVIKVIDQGADDSVNAANLRRFITRMSGASTTTDRTREATLIQTRHRIPEAPLHEGQVLVYQVPQPEPLYKLEPRRTETLKLHACEEYGLVNVKLYEDLAHWGRVETTYDYPVLVNGRYVMSPSPIPSFDNPKMHRNPALQLFGAGREKRLYAVPPYTEVKSLDFEDHPFHVEPQGHACALCGCRTSFLDEVVRGAGERLWTCSDTDWCREQQEAAA